MRAPARVLVAVLLPFLGLSPAFSQSGLKTINNPQGGIIVYGQVQGQSNESGAMAAILRSVDTQCGEKPKVSKLFQVRGTQSVAAFFTDTNHPKGNTPVAGMIIVTKVTTDHVEGALVTDNATRFNTTLQPMLKTLFSAWHPFDAARNGSGAASGGAIPVMHKAIAKDRSASVDLPENWQLDPNSAGGTMAASGPNGELVFLNIAMLASDTRNPRVQQTMRAVQQGSLRNTVYANAFYYPYGSDLAKTFVDVTQFMRHRNNLPPATFNIASETPMQSSASQHCSHITGHVNPQDGKGDRELNAVFCVTPPTQFGNYMTASNFTTIPNAIADKQRATVGAILASFQVDTAVVQREANAMAAPAIEQIHAIGRAAAARAAAAHEAQEIHDSSVYRHWDDMDKRSKEFENYQLGYSVISTTDHTAHGTFWNQDADWLVQNHPDKFEYVNAPDFWKGVDY